MTRPERLRLVADILEKDLPFEVLIDGAWVTDTNYREDWTGRTEIRIKPTPATVPLGPGDIPPGSVVRLRGWEEAWLSVECALEGSVRCGRNAYGYDVLKEGYEINRSVPVTGKWDPAAWKPCEKPA